MKGWLIVDLVQQIKNGYGISIGTILGLLVVDHLI